MKDYSFSNEELKELSVADPFVLKTKTGMYYLYGTTGTDGYDCWRSEDLVHWEERTVCFLAQESDWCGAGKTFWAPEVVEYEDRYYMFYSARNRAGSLRIGLAVSEHPAGPFKNIKNAPLFDFGYAAIDANVLADEDGKKYLYYSRDCSENTADGKKTSEIYGIRLSDDLTETVGEPVKLLTPRQGWELTSGEPLWNEGPEMLKFRERYYLSYSANFYAGPAYAVGYAAADEPLGPFVKAEENPILASVDFETGRKRGDVSGPGHHSFMVSPDGTELWAMYHSHCDPLNPSAARRPNLDRAGFTEDGKLFIQGPTTGLQPAPSCGEKEALERMELRTGVLTEKVHSA